MNWLFKYTGIHKGNPYSFHTRYQLLMKDAADVKNKPKPTPLTVRNGFTCLVWKNTVRYKLALSH